MIRLLPLNARRAYPPLTFDVWVWDPVKELEIEGMSITKLGMAKAYVLDDVGKAAKASLMLSETVKIADYPSAWVDH